MIENRLRISATVSSLCPQQPVESPRNARQSHPSLSASARHAFNAARLPYAPPINASRCIPTLERTCILASGPVTLHSFLIWFESEIDVGMLARYQESVLDSTRALD